MTKSYEFNWQKHLPEFMQEGASFDRFDEVNAFGFSAMCNKYINKIKTASNVKINSPLTCPCQIHDSLQHMTFSEVKI